MPEYSRTTTRNAPSDPTPESAPQSRDPNSSCGSPTSTKCTPTTSPSSTRPEPSDDHHDAPDRPRYNARRALRRLDAERTVPPGRLLAVLPRGPRWIDRHADRAGQAGVQPVPGEDRVPGVGGRHGPVQWGVGRPVGGRAPSAAAGP